MLPAAAANVAPLKDSYLFPHSVHTVHTTPNLCKNVEQQLKIHIGYVLKATDTYQWPKN